MPHAALTAGFTDPVFQSQAAFRAVMNALAEPGIPREIEGIAEAPAALGGGMAAIAATLADFDTTVWRDADLATAEVDAWLRFHTGAPLVTEAAKATFALVSSPERLPDFEDFELGTDVDPSSSTTVILRVAGFGRGRTYTLEGPGISGTRGFVIDGGPADLAERLTANRALFPRGVDLLLVGPDAVVGLPRTTRIREG